MKFIFPQNYNFKNKLFGVIDYSTAIFNIIIAVFVFCFLDLIFGNLNFIISGFIIIYMPILLFSIIGFNHENILYVALFIFKFIKNRKVYFYMKSNN